jgi:hypothetical protein
MLKETKQIEKDLKEIEKEVNQINNYSGIVVHHEHEHDGNEGFAIPIFECC